MTLFQVQGTNFAEECVGIVQRIREVPGLYIDSVTARYDKNTFTLFFIASRQIIEQYLKIIHWRFLPNIFQLNIY
jgi:hypothetical protein